MNDVFCSPDVSIFVCKMMGENLLLCWLPFCRKIGKLAAHFGFIDYVIYSRCLFLIYVPVVVTLFNGDKSPLLGAFCINSVGVIVTLILCISHIAFKCCIKHQVNDIQGVPEKKRAPFSNFGFTNLCDNYGPWTPRRFCYCDLCTYLILSMYDEIKGQLFLVYWPSSDQSNQVTSH